MVLNEQVYFHTLWILSHSINSSSSELSLPEGVKCIQEMATDEVSESTWSPQWALLWLLASRDLCDTDRKKKAWLLADISRLMWLIAQRHHTPSGHATQHHTRKDTRGVMVVWLQQQGRFFLTSPLTGDAYCPIGFSATDRPSRPAATFLAALTCTCWADQTAPS